MLDITGNGKEGEELPEDSILQNFINNYKMVADLMHVQPGSSYAL